MSYILKTALANKTNYGSKRNLSDIKYIVIHYTANDGDTDENNGKYFQGANRNASAHYFVDDDSITNSVPDDYIAWHCGTTNGYKHAECRNANSIGIEICDDVRNGVVYPSQATIDNVIAYTKTLMVKYNIPQENVIRHYDVTGKLCPAYWVDNTKWKTEFWNKLSNTAIAEQTTTKKSLLELVKEVLNGIWGNGSARKQSLTDAGYDYTEVQQAVNATVKGEKITDNTPTNTIVQESKIESKSIEEIAREVLNGAWGNGDDRKKRLTNAGYDYAEVQAKVNELAKGKTTATSTNKSVETIAREVIEGKWGNGATRKSNLEKAGYNYTEVQKMVNKLLK